MTWTPIRFEELSPKKLAILQELFRRGDLTRLLHPKQAEFKKFFEDNGKTITVLNVARQFGKSFLAAVIAIEHALRNPNARILYLAPTAVQARNIALPKINEVLQYRHPEIKVRVRMGMEWNFPNGAQIILMGAERQPEKIRGLSPNLVVIDEAAFFTNLDTLVDTIILPAFTVTRGRCLMISTPATTAGHPFRQYIVQAIKDGAYRHAAWMDNPLLDRAWLERDILPRFRGEDDPKYRIEYLADYNAQDTEFRVVPYFEEDQHAAFFADYEEPDIYQPYVGIDFGYHPNHSAVVFGFLDYKRATLVIQDEFSAGQLTSRQLAEAITAKELELWGNRPKGMPVLPTPERFCDNNSPMTVASFIRDHNITPLVQVRKTTQDEMLNRLNMNLDEKNGVKIRIHPRCKQLTHELTNGLWNRTRTDYEKQRDGTHLDCLDALKYLNLSVDWNKSPYNTGYHYNPDKVFQPFHARPQQANRTVRDKIFGL